MNNQKKYLYLKKSNLMIMPTLDESEDNRSIEGFGISYIEAAFFWCPIYRI